MPDLGRYAAEVLLAYGASAVLIGGLIAASLLGARRARRRLVGESPRGGAGGLDGGGSGAAPRAPGAVADRATAGAARRERFRPSDAILTISRHRRR